MAQDKKIKSVDVVYKNLSLEQAYRIQCKVQAFRNHIAKSCDAICFSGELPDTYTINIQGDFREPQYRLLNCSAVRCRMSDGKDIPLFRSLSGEIIDEETENDDSERVKHYLTDRFGSDYEGLFRACDGCGKNALRDNIYIVEDRDVSEDADESDKLKLAGSSCVGKLCRDEEFVKMLREAHAIAHEDEELRRSRNVGDKWHLDSRKFLACVLAVSKLDLADTMPWGPDMMNKYLSGGISKEYTKRQKANRSKAVKSVDDVLNLHSYTSNEKYRNDLEYPAHTRLWQWSEALYKVMYIDKNPESHKGLRYLMEKTDFVSECNSKEIRSLVEDLHHDILMTASMDNEKLKQVSVDFSSDDISKDNTVLYTRSSGEALINALGRQLEEKKRGSLDLEIKYRGLAYSLTPYYECNGTIVRVDDLERLGIDSNNRLLMSSIMQNGEYTMPEINDGIPVPSCTLRFNTNGSKSAHYSYRFGERNSTTGYYKTGNQYTFCDKGRTVCVFNKKEIHKHFGSDPSCEDLTEFCSALDSSGIARDANGLERMQRYDAFWRHSNKTYEPFPPIYDKIFYLSSGESFVFRKNPIRGSMMDSPNCIVDIKRNGTHVCRLLPKTLISEFVSGSNDYIDAIDKDIGEDMRKAEAKAAARIEAMRKSEQERKIKLGTSQTSVQGASRDGDVNVKFKVNPDWVHKGKYNTYVWMFVGKSMTPGGNGWANVWGIDKYLSEDKTTLTYPADGRMNFSYPGGPNPNDKGYTGQKNISPVAIYESLMEGCKRGYEPVLEAVRTPVGLTDRTNQEDKRDDVVFSGRKCTNTLGQSFVALRVDESICPSGEVSVFDLKGHVVGETESIIKLQYSSEDKIVVRDHCGNHSQLSVTPQELWDAIIPGQYTIKFGASKREEQMKKLTDTVSESALTGAECRTNTDTRSRCS